MPTEEKKYDPIPTLRLFHESGAQMRCIVGPVGSGKTTAAAWEMFYYLPQFLFETYGFKKTRWVIIRNTYAELLDTTQKTVFEWFSWGKYKAQRKDFIVKYPNGVEIEALFRSCDRPDDVKKFKSLEITGYWIDESIEVDESIKLMLKNRIGRYPRKSPVRFGIETTNPPDVEHSTYSIFKWHIPPPGPIPEGVVLDDHAGFWQPPRENEANLRDGYYDELIRDYAGSPDWKEMYVDGKPGIIVKGKLVYNNFTRARHVALKPLIWAKGDLYRGWDNSGNTPACVVIQIPTATHVQVLSEFHSPRMNMVDFTRYVNAECKLRYPNANFYDYADPAGAAKYSTKEGTFTSNHELMKGEGVYVVSSEQNWMARLESVDQALGRYDGVLVDPGCTRLINGFLGGYCLPRVGTTDTYQDKPNKQNKFTHIHDSLQYVLVKMSGFERSSGIFRPDRSKNISAPSKWTPRRGRRAA